MKSLLLRVFPIFAMLIAPAWGVEAQVGFKQTPCKEMGLPQMAGMPAGMPIGMFSGHAFRKGDGCVPFDLVVTWTERYEEDESWYEADYVQHIPGALWYRKDKNDFVLNANELMYEGYADIRGFRARGKSCSGRDSSGRCKGWITYDNSDIRPQRSPMGGYQGMMFYGPATTVTDPELDQEDIPEQFMINSVRREFRNRDGEWRPPTPEINNGDLVDFDYKEFVLAAVEKRPLTKTVTWDRNEDPEEAPTWTRGSVTLHFIFDPPCPEQLLVRADRKNYRFSEDSEGTVVVNAEVIDTGNFPTPYLADVEWDVPAPAGTSVRIEHPDGKKYRARITYKGLPEGNRDLGPQAIKASVFLGSKCGRLERGPEVRLFFPRDAKNNPKGSEPNWYYYWQQTSAGHGTVADQDIRYGGSAPECAMNKWWMGVFPTDEKNFGTAAKPILALLGRTYVYLCNFAKAEAIFPVNAQGQANTNFYLQSRLPFSRDSWEGIDTFGVVTLHELTHRKHWRDWWKKLPDFPDGVYPVDGYYDNNGNGEQDPSEPMLDSDKDYIPDSKEADFKGAPYFMEFKVGERKSHHVAGDDMTDEHVLTYTASEDPGTGWKTGSADKEDWASPGKQWKDE